MENSNLEKKSEGKLIFDLAEAIRFGKAWTRCGYFVKITDVMVGCGDLYALAGVLHCNRLYRDCWTLDGRHNIELEFSPLDLTTVEP